MYGEFFPSLPYLMLSALPAVQLGSNAFFEDTLTFV